MFQKHMDKLVGVVTSSEFSQELISAKEEYFSKTGEVFEDDKTFENRMNSFTEWYCFDRMLKTYQKTPIKYFIDSHLRTFTDEEKNIYTGFSNNVHSIFYIKRIKKDKIVIKDISSGKKFSVSEDDSNLLFHKDDIFETRLVPFDEKYFFSSSFCFHPMGLYKKIKKELKVRADNQEEKNNFFFMLSLMSLRLERSRQIDFNEIYKF